MRLNVDTTAVIAHTKRLEAYRKSALPNAVRETLNRAALDVKQRTMPKQAKDEFFERNKTFFKATSKVEFAKGKDIAGMASKIGFTENTLAGKRKGYSQAIDDLEQQEQGGSIASRTFVPMNTARKGFSRGAPVKNSFRLAQLKMVDASKAQGVNEGQKFIKSVYHAGKGGFVIGRSFVWRVNSLQRGEDGKLKITPIYSKETGRSVKVDRTHFMRDASLQSADKLNQFFIQEAEKQLKRVR